MAFNSIRLNSPVIESEVAMKRFLPARSRKMNRRPRRSPSFLSGFERLEDRRMLTAGHLDLTFGGGDGIVTTDVASPASVNNFASASAVQADGKILVSGTAGENQNSQTDYRFSLARYNTDGSLDTTFGNGGTATLKLQGDAQQSPGLAVLSDGRILQAGTVSKFGNTDIVVVRYLADGILDLSFGGGDGIATFSVNSASREVVNDITVDGSERILLAGSLRNKMSGTNYSDPFLLLGRMTSDGEMDVTFGGGDGHVWGNFGGLDSFTSVAVQAGGRIVVGGSAITASGRDLVTVGYTDAGVLDTEFGVNGFVTVDLGGQELLSEMLVGVDGIYLGGQTRPASGFHSTALVKLTSDGSPDTTFGSGGVITTRFGLNESAYGGHIGRQSDGAIILSGTTASGNDVLLSRYSPVGVMDATFGSGGVAQTTIPGGILRNLIVTSDGILGSGSLKSDDGGFDVYLAKFSANGLLDESFGESGIVVSDLPTSGRNLPSQIVMTQPDGKLLILGVTLSGVDVFYDFYAHYEVRYDLLRYTADGSLDATFGGGDGIIALSGSANSMAVQPDGKILLASGNGFGTDILRLNEDGSIDTTFGNSGILSANFDVAVYTIGLAIQVDGRIVLSGDAYDAQWGGNGDLFLARFHPDGQLDTSFGTEGLVITDLEDRDGVYHYSYWGPPLIQPDGRLIAMSNSYDNSFGNATNRVLRYNVDGSVDTSFGDGGQVIGTAVGVADGYLAALQSDGKLVIAGYNASYTETAVSRLNADGSVDTTFGLDGTVSITTENSYFTGLGIQEDGRIVLGGDRYNSESGAREWMVARFESDGSVDGTFGNSDGFVSVQMSPVDAAPARPDYAIGMVIQPSGRIVLAGSIYSPAGMSDFALAGFERGPLATANVVQSDLVIKPGGLSFSSTNPNAGEQVTISVVVQNAGQTAATGVSIAISDFSTPLGTIVIDSLAPGESRTVSVVASFPNTGHRMISAEVDSLHVISELSETNNSASQVLQIGTPTVAGAVIFTTVYDRTACEGTFTTITGSAFYDFAEVAGTQDYPVKGGLVTLNLINPLTGLTLTTYSGFHTEVNGSFSFTILTPMGAGAFDLRATVTDSSVSDLDWGVLNVTACPPNPESPPIVAPPVESFTAVESPGPGISFGGGSTEPEPYGRGAATAPAARDVYVYSEQLLFSESPATLGVPVTLFSMVHYNGEPVSGDVGVTYYDIFPVGGTLQKFAIGSTSVSFSEGAGSSPVAATQSWTPGASGPHIIEVSLSAGFDQPLQNDAATRLISVGGTGALTIETTGQLLVDADNSGSITAGDTLRYTLTARNTGNVSVSNAFVIDDFDETLLVAPDEISDNGGIVDGTVVWSFGTLTGGESRVVSYDVQVLSTAEMFPGTAAGDIPGEAVLANVSFVTGDGVPAGADSTRVLVTLTVPNQSPVANAGGPYLIAEGSLVQLDGSGSSDAEDGTNLTLLWDLDGDGHFGELGDAATRGVEVGSTPVFNASGLDGPSVIEIGLRVIDAKGAQSEAWTFITITNVAPTTAIAGPTTAVPGQLRSFSGSFSDPGLADTHTADWQIVDSSNVLVSSGPGTSIDFTPEHPGSYTVRFTVTDDDGGVGVAEHSVLVSMFDMQPDPCDPALTALVVGGTSAGDHILFTLGAAAGDIVATVNGVVLGTFQPSGRIMAYGLEGDDNLQVAGSIELSAWLYGQDGDDRLKGGAGDDLLLGGHGEDLVVGGSGRDVQIGGMGADRIVGSADDDLLIAGMTRYDDDAEALCAIVDEWTSDHSYEQRIANLTGTGSDAAFAARHNGHVFLKTGPTASESTLFDDFAEDILTGSAGLDWFLFSMSQDRVTDLKDELFADDLQFIFG